MVSSRSLGDEQRPAAKTHLILPRMQTTSAEQWIGYDNRQQPTRYTGPCTVRCDGSISVEYIEPYETTKQAPLLIDKVSPATIERAVRVDGTTSGLPRASTLRAAYPVTSPAQACCMISPCCTGANTGSKALPSPSGLDAPGLAAAGCAKMALACPANSSGACSYYE